MGLKLLASLAAAGALAATPAAYLRAQQQVDGGWGSPQLTAWSVLASKILNGGAASGSTDQPFSTPPPLTAASTTFQRLTITLVAGTSGPSSTSTTRSSLTFTASNSIASDNGGNAGRCQQPLVGTLMP